MKISERTIFTKSQKRRISLFLLLMLTLLGIVIGAVMVGFSDSIKWLNRLIFTNNFYKNKDGLSVINQFFRSIAPLYAVFLLQFFSGMFAFGQTLAVLTVIYRGAASGISASIIYLILGIKGFFAVLITVLPFALFSAALVILGARESVKFSGQIARYSFLQKKEDAPPDIRLYSLKFGVLLLFGFLFSAADTLITYFLNPLLF